MQAKTGGEYGLNGEWYKGGQFLPEYTDSQKQKRVKYLKTHKQEIAPYYWQISTEGKEAIWPKISGLVEFVGQTWYSKESGRSGEIKKVSFNYKAMGWSDEGLREFEQLVERWNQGERWL